ERQRPRRRRRPPRGRRLGPAGRSVRRRLPVGRLGGPASLEPPTPPSPLHPGRPPPVHLVRPHSSRTIHARADPVPDFARPRNDDTGCAAPPQALTPSSAPRSQLV